MRARRARGRSRCAPTTASDACGPVFAYACGVCLPQVLVYDGKEADVLDLASFAARHADGGEAGAALRKARREVGRLEKEARERRASMYGGRGGGGEEEETRRRKKRKKRAKKGQAAAKDEV